MAQAPAKKFRGHLRKRLLIVSQGRQDSMSSQIKLCIHWTAGGPTPTNFDRRPYHFLVDQAGNVINGVHPPEANFKQLTNRDKYAAHCGGGNSWTIGVALCGMRENKRGRSRGYLNPLTEKQCEAAWELIAKLCLKYRIPVSPATVYTHYEFGRLHPGTDSAGKIDITQIPFAPDIKPNDVGQYIRNKILWYIKKETANK